MQKYNILWADDEIDLLKPHILFLEKKGYDITPVNSGTDAIEKCDQSSFDIVFLDENMPGMSGLETLNYIKTRKPNLPVVMITKSEEEHIMEEAIGSRIADYLIKPINPNQILMSIKKILDNKRLVNEKTTSEYQQEFRSISMAFGDRMDHDEWVEIYKKLVYWELEMERTDNEGMSEILDMQKGEANLNFSKFIEENYEDWLNEPDMDRPLLSHRLMKEKVMPQLSDDKPVFMVIIDNLRWDQWKVIEPALTEYFKVEKEESYYSILPTTTAYARNSIFSGMLPLEMSTKYPQLWAKEEDEGGKNNFEDKFLEKFLERNHKKIKWSYNKIKNLGQGKHLAESVHNLFKNDLNVIVYNFVDMLSHARTDMKVIRELAPDESAYRSITKSWFDHSPLFEILKKVAKKDAKLIITTDHGTVRTQKPIKIVGDRDTNSNLRYKIGRNLGYDKKEKVFASKEPKRLHLPQQNLSDSFVFATEDQFFAYPNNYNYYVKYYKDTFQHGGVSMEEMIIPLISLNSR